MAFSIRIQQKKEWSAHTNKHPQNKRPNKRVHSDFHNSKYHNKWSAISKLKCAVTFICCCFVTLHCASKLISYVYHWCHSMTIATATNREQKKIWILNEYVCFITPRNGYGNDSGYQNTVILFDALSPILFTSSIVELLLWSDSINNQHL